jgi:hypothetical protein
MGDNRGGARRGAGRKRKADEARIQEMAAKALISKYGSEQDAFKALLDSKEPSLIKFAYEHAFGKPREKVDMDTSGKITLIIKRGNRADT